MGKDRLLDELQFHACDDVVFAPCDSNCIRTSLFWLILHMIIYARVKIMFLRRYLLLWWLEGCRSISGNFWEALVPF